VGGGQLEAGDCKPSARAARAKDDLVSLRPQSILGLDGMLIDKARGAGLFKDFHSQPVQMLAGKRLREQFGTTSRTRASSRGYSSTGSLTAMPY